MVVNYFRILLNIWDFDYTILYSSHGKGFSSN